MEAAKFGHDLNFGIAALPGTFRAGGFGAQQQGGASRLRQMRFDENSVIGRLRTRGNSQNNLTSTAQARGTNQREPRSGTGTVIPRCLPET
jgi:hypothetical protein